MSPLEAWTCFNPKKKAEELKETTHLKTKSSQAKLCPGQEF